MNELMQRARAATELHDAPNEDVLRKRVEQLEAALKPFVWDERDLALFGSADDGLGVRTSTTLGDVRQAREALKGGGDA